jgi:hypothetical protein
MFDLNNYLQELQQNTEAILLTTQKYATLNNDKRKEGKWSVLQTAEHLYIVDVAVMTGMLRPNLEPISENELYGKEKLHKIIVKLRARKTLAPNGMSPIDQFETIQDFRKAFTFQREKLVSYLANGKIIVDNRKYIHPYLGDMSVSDWCYFLILHAQRHLLQIEERNILSY